MDLALVDVPCLERLILHGNATSTLNGSLPLRIFRAPELKVLGYLDAKDNKIQIGDIVIEVLYDYMIFVVYDCVSTWYICA
jgi:hypothetical protein